MSHMSIDDLLAGGELLNTRFGYCPNIDPDTRRILLALQEDMLELRDTIDAEHDEDRFMTALFITEILQDILSRNHENTRFPESMTWLGRWGYA